MRVLLLILFRPGMHLQTVELSAKYIFSFTSLEEREGIQSHANRVGPRARHPPPAPHPTPRRPPAAPHPEEEKSVTILACCCTCSMTRLSPREKRLRVLQCTRDVCVCE